MYPNIAILIVAASDRNDEPQVAVSQITSSPVPAKVEPPKPLTEAERIAKAIKHMWIAPCKEWMCLNK